MLQFFRQNRARAGRFIVAALFLVGASLHAQSQNESIAEVRRETLLNGLKVVFAPRPNETQVVLKLRVDGGAQFDLAGKEGTMALLADTLFPDAETRQIVAKEFGGELDAHTDYDALYVTLSGRSEDFRSLFETLRSAVLNSLPAPDVIAKLTEARRALAAEQMKNPSLIADRAIAARLYGSYPLGRPVEGTPESIARITRADLALARQRFLNPNNSVLIITGNFDERYARAAVSQFFGVWRKSEAEVSATFRQPEPPNAKPLIINLPDKKYETVRFAARGLARDEADRTAADILALTVQGLCNRTLNHRDDRQWVLVTHKSYRLGGMFVVRPNINTISASEVYKCTDEAIQSLLKSQPDESFPFVLKWAKQYRQAQLAANGSASPLEDFASTLLNETVTGVSLVDEFRAIDAITQSDIQRVAAKFLRNFPQASVAIGEADNFQRELSKLGVAEIIDVQTFVASLSVDPGKPARDASNVRPLTSLAPPPPKTQNNQGRQPFLLPKQKPTSGQTTPASPAPTPSPTPVKQP
jgi:zinc protease